MLSDSKELHFDSDNMKSTRFSVLLISLCITWSCSTQNQKSNETPIVLKGKELPAEIFFEFSRMSVHDSLLIMRMRRQSSEGIALSIMNLNNCSIISQAIKIGRGPGELVNPIPFVIDERSDELWIVDWALSKVFRYKLDSLIRDPQYTSSYSFPIDPNWIPTMNLFYHPSGHLGFTSVFLPENLISFVDTLGNLVDSLTIPNKVYPNLWLDGGISDTPHTCYYVPEKNKIVVAKRYENSLAVIDMKGKPEFILTNFPEKLAASPSSNFITNYTVCADDTYIYLFYLGDKIYTYNIETDKAIGNYPTKMIVLNWEGEVIYNVDLDHELMYITLDKKRRRIMGATPDFDNLLISYDLTPLFNEK